MAQFHMHF
jgi:hypothetical protein